MWRCRSGGEAEKRCGVLASAVYMADTADPHFEGTIIDITDRKQASDRLVTLLQTEQHLKEMGDLLDARLSLPEVLQRGAPLAGGDLLGGAGALHDQRFPQPRGVGGELGRGRGRRRVRLRARRLLGAPPRAHACGRGKRRRARLRPPPAAPARRLPLHPLVAQGEAVGVLHLSAPPGARCPSSRKSSAWRARPRTSWASLANLALRERLRTQSVRDHLTSLFNRRYMEETLERELRRAQRNGLPLSVITIDVDHFKRFNDDQSATTRGRSPGRAGTGPAQPRPRGGRALPGGRRVEFAIVLPGAAARTRCAAPRSCAKPPVAFASSIGALP